jgi:hypothetical protein
VTAMEPGPVEREAERKRKRVEHDSFLRDLDELERLLRKGAADGR